MGAPTATVAVIGGSGFYSFLDDVEQVTVTTPYGDPSGPISVAVISGKGVAFLPRHGPGHAFPPHRINYRANMWALRSLGVRRVLAPSAAGGLRDVARGDVLLPEQLVDRTRGRADTYVDSGAAHVPFADPYCPDLTRTVAAVDPGIRVGGTMVVVEGPRFSTRAESRHYAEQGWALVNMTGYPEAVLAREMLMCYLCIALVTDMDAGVEVGSGVGQADVFAMFAENLERLKTLLADAVAALPDDGERAISCDCAGWAEGIDLPYAVPGPAR